MANKDWTVSLRGEAWRDDPSGAENVNGFAGKALCADIRIAADHPTNPTGQDLLLIRRLLVEPGQRQFFQETDTYRFVGGARGTAMAFDGVVVQRRAIEFPQVAQPLGGLALGGQRKALVDAPAERHAMHVAVAAHRHPRHALGAAGHHHVGQTRCDGADRDMHRGLGGPAFAVDRHAGDALRPSGRQQRGTCDVAALFADLRDAAEHHVVDLLWLQTGAFEQRTQDRGAQMVGAHMLETAAKAAHRRARGLDNDDVAHQKGLTPEFGIRTPLSSYS